ncbi:hypothetical protein QOZ83_03955 [Romboutsia sedimentorum]|uniref:hypothetical protein n=1 Tax=Romboutsia sedimentorum TaxID=1368474 RepID=UPI0024DE2A37|nr:hypothetical protein [Romboutsia sedimentorum]MDK2585005.1 hypothetical protein [Romboutsia sedimentorum]
MRLLIKELFIPITDFYRISKRNEKFKNYILPLIIGLIYIIGTYFIKAMPEFNIRNFGNDFINTTITVITLLITFSMAYLTILVTGDNSNIKDLKSTVSERKIKNKQIVLYQVMLINISYTTVVEIAFLVIIFFQKFLLQVVSKNFIHIILMIDLMVLTHILLLLLQIIINIYFSFWKVDLKITRD